jgi:hypothetical protein
LTKIPLAIDEINGILMRNLKMLIGGGQMNRAFLCIFAFCTSVISAQSTNQQTVGPKPLHVASDTPQEWVKDCAEPISRTAPVHTNQIRLTAVCDETCKEQKTEIDLELLNLMKIEKPNSCFTRFFDVQPPLDEPHGSTNAQIANDLTVLPATLNIHFNDKPTIAFIGMTACGGEFINRPNYIDTKKVCWNSYGSSRTPSRRASYLAHEIAHTVGYTHLCTNPKKKVNLEKGNELTVPYVTDAAVAFCWDEVINGGTPKKPEAIVRANP